ncbi:TPA: hypothetical protein MM152_003764 [Klebsiella pneumoniae]|uniref:hypothetical protein n=1 Tax=Klebsiella TaxID=570 RepID=UPI0011588162|nr:MULTISPECIES: hypothetical protein [Klebsiella]HBY0669090.1 hypothetical protein [Klebsiella pneumoniae subsp. pneumoniae]HCI9398963.1 hypothetical protein [Klebsiella variicola]EIX9221969.1 hypothetical protein [Klebsiella pneumoniae]HBX7388137.1 hypothetical protein [Klebsiella pneumoniae]HBZ3376987.1 hypothetical protein [Klebsiella pneumoniae]
MDIGFIDLDILLTRIRHPQSKAYFLDAVKAYKAGALRGALTSAWVALVYDLIAKYRELSAMGDAAAAAFLQSWDNATKSGDIPKLLQLEGSIIENATTDTQAVNRIARTHLDRLREDRHLCAHPAFSAEANLFEPSHELVRLHLVNAVEFVLSQDPLQGKAIFDLYDVDVQSPGFPTAYERILDYVEQRYLVRVRAQNIGNFGTVLAKSLLKGVPAQWEELHHKIIISLVAVRERAGNAWPDVSLTIVRLIDSLEPHNRLRVISFIAVFPEFWQRLQEPTRIALQETIENAVPEKFTDYRVLTGVTFPQFRTALLAIIAGLTQQQLADAITFQPLTELLDKAIGYYKDSGSWRGSEENFASLITPFAGRLSQQQFDQLLNAITSNGQNWDAAGTDKLLLGMLSNAMPADLPSHEARDAFYRHISYWNRSVKYGDVFAILQSDGWIPPLQEQGD